MAVGPLQKSGVTMTGQFRHCLLIYTILNISCAFWALVIGVIVSLICEPQDFKAAAEG